MFYSLTGKLIHTDSSVAVVECGGVGFKCSVTSNTLRALPSTGATVTLYTHLNVREDALDLFGFLEEAELNFFRLLISVSGVGAKVALSILSDLTPERIAISVATSDAKALSRASGVGPKLAQRIILELKDKVGAIDAPEAMGAYADGQPSGEGNNLAQAISALMVLGYSSGEASLAVSRQDGSLPVEDLIKGALKSLVKR